MRQKTRKTLLLVGLALFPLTFNYFSPYLSIDGALQGIVAGSVIVFVTMLITAMVSGRLWCGWLCPMGGLGEVCLTINARKVNAKRLKWFRYGIFVVWFSVLIGGFFMAGGINSINFWHLSENYISIDEPMKFIVYYLVLLIFFSLNITLGSKGACHSLCWMSPFLTFGTWVGRKLHLPQVKVVANTSACIGCHNCDRHCSMSINVSELVKTGKITSLDCIGCGECIDHCPKKVLKFGIDNNMNT